MECAIKYLVIALLIEGCGGMAYCTFRNLGWGSRPEGMGGAFVAVADDVNSITYNPAGTALMGGSEISFSYAKPYSGLSSNVNLDMFHTSFAMSVNRHLGYGIGWTNFTSNNFMENSVLLNFSFNLGAIFNGIGGDLVLGTNIKRMSHSFILDDRTVSDPVFKSGSEMSLMSYDSGLWSRPFPEVLPGISYGMVLKDLNQPDAGLHSEDIVFREFAGGIAYTNKKYLFTFDYSVRNHVNTFKGGGEIWFFNRMFGIRTGGNSNNGSFGLSYRHPIGKFNIHLDYAFIMPFFIQGTSGTHRFSFILRV